MSRSLNTEALAISLHKRPEEREHAADLNGDGKPDLVTANGNAVAVLLGNGDGTFQEPVSYLLRGEGTASVVVADVNRDGKPDLLVASVCIGNGDCSSASAVVLLGNGDGTFQSAQSYGSGGTFSSGLAVADVNGDGKLDLALSECDNRANCENGTVGVLLGNGDGTFQAPVSYSSGGSNAWSIWISDVNGDGKADIELANQCIATCANGSTIGVLLGNGDGTLQTAQWYRTGGQFPLSVTVADVDRDEKPDLLVLNRLGGTPDGSASVGVLINISSATSLLSSLNPSNFGQTVTFSVTVTAPPLGMESSTRAPSAAISFVHHPNPFVPAGHRRLLCLPQFFASFSACPAAARSEVRLLSSAV
jgi:hypothetical protein